jgi:hypothetical protein
MIIYFKTNQSVKESFNVDNNGYWHDITSRDFVVRYLLNGTERTWFIN